MSHCLTYYCDTTHTQQLMGMFGDRLQQMGRADLLEFITIFSAACNTDLDSPHSEDDLFGFMSAMEMVCSVHIDAALEIMDGFDRRMNSALLLGLAAMNHDRGEVSND